MPERNERTSQQLRGSFVRRGILLYEGSHTRKIGVGVPQQLRGMRPSSESASDPLRVVKGEAAEDAGQPYPEAPGELLSREDETEEHGQRGL